MNQQMKLHILGARRGSVDGNKYASVYVTQRAEDGDKDNIGVLPMKLSCDFDILEALDPKNLPGEYDCMVRLQPASGGKVGMFLTSVKWTKGTHTPAPAASAAAK
jgi:hypothetical protein